MRLLGVELTRLRWRRAAVVLLLACVLIPAVLFAGLAWNTRPVSEADLRQAQQEVERYAATMEQDVESCLASPRRHGIPRSEDPERLCREFYGEEPQVDWFLHRPQLDVEREREGTGLGVVTILIGLVMLLGTTFAGHDWNSGSMSNQLLFEPRRARVWTAKAMAVLLAGLVTAAVVLTGWWGAVWMLAESRDLTTAPETWEQVREGVGRAVPLVAGAGLGAYALTMFFRSTVATLGVLFAVAIGGNLLLVAVLGEQATRWLLPTNVMAVLLDGLTYYDPSIACPPRERFCDQQAMLTLAGGATYLGVLLLVAVLASVWSFRRRDVP